MRKMKGTIKVRLGNNSQEPMVVYVQHFQSKMRFWVVTKLNTKEVFFAKAKNLIDYKHDEFEVMLLKWEIDNADRLKERLKALLSDLESTNQKS